jgi:bacillolysin
MTARPLLLVGTVVLTLSQLVIAKQEISVRELSLTADQTTAAATNHRVARMISEGRLVVSRVTEDTMVAGRVHERLAQRHEGLPVFGGEIVRQIENGTVRTVFGKVYENIQVAVTPTVLAEDAVRLATSMAGEGATSGAPTLGVLPMSDQYVLAWQVPVRSLRDLEHVFVDAASGVILRRKSKIRRQFEDIGLGRGVLNDEKKVVARRTATDFETFDVLRPGPIITFDFAGSTQRLNAWISRSVLNPSDTARDADNVWSDGAVVDAHVYQGFSYDYYFKRFARRGIDDANSPVTTIVHPLARADIGQYDDDTINTFIMNALYISGERTLIFGDGDGRLFDYFSAALDVVAHEWTHGVTEYGSNLNYEDESGALNESFSDIMGTAAEFMFQEAGSGSQRADWLVGEDIVKTGGPLRSMSDPASLGYPDHYLLRRFIGTDFDSGGIHINSSIPNHAFYLAVNGGRNRVSGLTVQGVGVANMERMERIFYRAFVYFLTPNARFSDARAATLAAATELFGGGSNEFQQLQQAWTAVGVN